MALKLVQLGLSGAAMFGADREVLQPSEVLRKKAILVERGSFRPPTVRQHRHARVRAREVRGRPRGRRARRPAAHRAHDGATCAPAATTSTGATSWPAPTCSSACGMTVLISDYVAYHRLAAYLAWRTDGPDRDGHGRPEPASTSSTRRTTPTCPAASWRASAGCSRTTCGSSSIRCCATSDVVTVDNRRGRRGPAAALRLPRRARQLRRTSTTSSPTTCPSSADVLKRIKARDESWEKMVPPAVAEVIKRRGFFGYAKGAGD